MKCGIESRTHGLPNRGAGCMELQAIRASNFQASGFSSRDWNQWKQLRRCE